MNKISLLASESREAFGVRRIPGIPALSFPGVAG